MIEIKGTIAKGIRIPSEAVAVEAVADEHRAALPELSIETARAERTLEGSRAKAKAKHIEELDEHMEHVQTERARTDMELPSRQASRIQPIASFLCPITCELMEDPVSTVDGQVYTSVPRSKSGLLGMIPPRTRETSLK